MSDREDVSLEYDDYEPLRDEDIVRLDDDVDVGHDSEGDDSDQEREFANALASAVSSSSATIGSRAKRKADDSVTKAMEEERRLKQMKKELKQLRERGHNKHPQASEKEKRLVKIATKGVVTLFNAVSKQQQALQNPTPSTSAIALTAGSKVASHDSFMQLLKRESMQTGAGPAKVALLAPPKQATIVPKPIAKPKVKAASWDEEIELE